MIPKHLNLFLAVFLSTLLFTSCLQNRDDLDSPLIPSLANQSDKQSGEFYRTSHQLWGFFLVYGDTSRTRIDIVPVRDIAQHWNVLQFLEYGPCTDCFSVAEASWTDDNTLLCDIEIRHPFPTLNLSGFDVRGIMMFNGSAEFPVAGVTTSNRLNGEGELVNADGYTTLYNPTTAGSGAGGLQG